MKWNASSLLVAGDVSFQVFALVLSEALGPAREGEAASGSDDEILVASALVCFAEGFSCLRGGEGAEG